MDVKKPKAHTSSKNKDVAASSCPSVYVISVSGDKNPFVNAAYTLSRSAWNRLRVYIQFVNAFPRNDERRSVIIDLIRDLVLAVPLYRRVWKQLSSDHRYLMVDFVCLLPFPFIIFLYRYAYVLGFLDMEGRIAGSRRVETECSPNRQGQVFQGLY